MFEWTEVKLTRTNEFETTRLSDVDTAFGNFLLSHINGIKVTHPTQKERDLVSFINLPANEKLFIGEYEDPKEFLRNLMSDKRARRGDIQEQVDDALKLRINKRACPIVYFYRSPELNPVDYSVEQPLGEASAMEGLLMSTYYVQLTFHVFILAFDQNALDGVTNGLMSSLQLKQKSFPVQTQLCDVEAELEAKIMDAAMIGFENASLIESDRLLAQRAMITVMAEQARADHIKEQVERYVLNEKAEVLR